MLPLLLACSGTSPATDPPTPLPGDAANYTGALGAEPDFSTPHSVVRTLISTFEDLAVLEGAFADGPPLSFHEESERDGSCRIVRYTPSTCTPTCAGSEACIAGSCVAYPVRTPVGALEWGFPGGSKTVEPDGTNGYFETADVTEEGPMTLTVDGQVLEVPAAPQMTPDGSWDLNERDGDGVLRWSNPMEGARVRLHMTDCTGSHGGFAEAELECEGPDTGELVIPEAFMTVMENADWSRGECGTHRFERYHAASLPGDDGTRFEVRSVDSLFYRAD